MGLKKGRLNICRPLLFLVEYYFSASFMVWPMLAGDSTT